MWFQSGDDYLELTPIEQTLEGVPGFGDTSFSVRVRCGSFSGETTVYIEAGELSEFAEELRRVEEARQGAAAVESMSPGELLLEVRITDRAGHAAVIGQVGSWSFVGFDSAHWNVVGYRIPFCPTLLPQIRREFRALVEAAHATTTGTERSR
jgi:hypothetical protein